MSPATKKAIGRPGKFTPDMLHDILDAMLKPYSGLNAVAKKHKISVQAIFRWQKMSAQDEADGVADSPFLIDYLDTRSYFHRHMAFVRAVAVARIDHRIVEAATVPHMEPQFSAQTGNPHWQVDPKIAADALSMSDDLWTLTYGDADHERPRSDVYMRDAEGKLIQIVKEVPPQPALLIKAAASLLSATYGERVAHTLVVGGVVRIGPTMAPPSKQLAPPPTHQILDVDFTPIEEEKAAEPTNVLLIADEPETVEEYERTFGGKRLVEAILFYAEDKTLMAPLPEIVIVEGSSIHRAYQEAGIEVNAVPASQLLAQGYCNDFLLAMATSAERKLAEAKLKEPIKNQVPVRALQPPPPPVDDEPVTAAKDNRVSRDPFMNLDGTPKSGGFSINGAPQLRRRTVS
jgi:hypothetical protein